MSLNLWQRKLDLNVNDKNSKTVGALTHTHTQYVYKIKENSKKLNIKSKIEILCVKNNVKKFLFAIKKIDENISLCLVNFKPLDTS